MAQPGAPVPANEAAKIPLPHDNNTPSPQGKSGGNKKDSIGGRLSRVLSQDKGDGSLGRKFFSAYAKTWIGMSPIWLMGEALTPNRKVGTTFRGASKELLKTGEIIRKELAVSADDVIVIIDKKLRSGATDTVGMTQDVIKAAGENAIVLVTSNIDKAAEQLHKVSPDLKKFMQKEGRDAIIMLDKSLKNPVVITGVERFARSKGIPHSAALLKLASLALAKILESIPEAVQEAGEELAGDKRTGITAPATSSKPGPAGGAKIQELDASELERTASAEAEKEATEIEKEAEELGKQAEGGTEGPKTPGGMAGTKGKEKAKQQKPDGCVIS